MFVRHRRFLRRGIGTVQTVVILAVIAIAVVASVRALGTSTRGELNQTASDVGDPSTLVNRWKESGSQEGDADGGTDDEPTYGYR